jgi:hypothetical protein
MMSSGRGGRPFPHSVSHDVEALPTREDIGLRERTLRRLLYENAARSASHAHAHTAFALIGALKAIGVAAFLLRLV